jgi:hypothetical protein
MINNRKSWICILFLLLVGCQGSTSITGLAVGDIGNAWIDIRQDQIGPSDSFEGIVMVNPDGNFDGDTFTVTFPDFVSVTDNDVTALNGFILFSSQVQGNQLVMETAIFGNAVSEETGIVRIDFTADAVGDGELQLTGDSPAINTYNNVPLAVAPQAQPGAVGNAWLEIPGGIEPGDSFTGIIKVNPDGDFDGATFRLSLPDFISVDPNVVAQNGFIVFSSVLDGQRLEIETAIFGSSFDSTTDILEIQFTADEGNGRFGLTTIGAPSILVSSGPVVNVAPPPQPEPEPEPDPQPEPEPEPEPDPQPQPQEGNQISNSLYRAVSIAQQNLQVAQNYDFSTRVTALDASQGRDLFIVTEMIKDDRVVGFKKDIIPNGLAPNEQFTSTINYQYNGPFTKKVYVYSENMVLSDDAGDPLITEYQ